MLYIMHTVQVAFSADSELVRNSVLLLQETLDIQVGDILNNPLSSPGATSAHAGGFSFSPFCTQFMLQIPNFDLPMGQVRPKTFLEKERKKNFWSRTHPEVH